jgi:hypothetical protein
MNSKESQTKKKKIIFRNLRKNMNSKSSPMDTKSQLFFNSVTDKLLDKSLTKEIIDQELDPSLNLEIFKMRDEINNFILTYAIFWRNLPLLEYFFEKFRYEDIKINEKDFIRDFTKEIFLVIRRLSKMIKRNGEFIFSLLNIIEASSFRLILLEIVKQPDIYFYFERKTIHFYLYTCK